MAILRGIPRRTRRPVHTKRIMIDTVRGVLRVRKWPMKRGTPKSALQRFWIDWFRQANLLAKYADPMSQVRAKEMAAGSGMYPRDILLKAMRGRLYNWTDENGWRWYSMAAIGNVSETLDVLAQSVGSVLVRALDRWRAPDPGDVGDVLTYKGPAAIPEWLPAAAPGAGLQGALVTMAGNQAIPNVTNTVLIWDVETYDTDNVHDMVTNPGRLTVPAGWSAVQLSMQVRWQNSSTANRVIFILKNAGQFVGRSYKTYLARGNAHEGGITAAVQVVAGDYFTMSVWHNKGGNWNVEPAFGQTWFAMQRIG